MVISLRVNTTSRYPHRKVWIIYILGGSYLNETIKGLLNFFVG